jgi:hypothetical protein
MTDKMERRLEYRLRSARSQHVTALTDAWEPATVARVAEEVVDLLAVRDPTAVLEIRQRQGVRGVAQQRRRRPA